MRSTLYIKFALVYIVFAFLSVFCVSIITSDHMMTKIEKQTSEALYKEATLFSTDYLPNFSFESKYTEDIQEAFDRMRSHMDASIWLVSEDGTVLFSSTRAGYKEAPSKIENFESAKNDTKEYSAYYGEKTVSFLVPVTSSRFSGYLLVHKAHADLVAQRNEFLVPVYVTVAVIYVLSFLILFAFQLMVYQPLRKITEAAKQYASGNLEYEIPVTTQDEIGYLSASLNYMSSHLKDMDDYQKKFIGNVSHDFRSPLTSIKGYLQALADGTIPVEMQDRYFKILLFETERLTDLTEDLLTLNEFDTQRLILDISKFDIHEIIKNTATSFEGTCNDKYISIELKFPDKQLEVKADKRKIQQVLYNLLDNAIKFSPSNSEIVIKTIEKNGKVFVSVKDRGFGIPKQSLAKIWDRFYKTDLSRGKDKKGTGLGLPIVKEIIQAHNENINVVSTEGVGTEFTFSLSK